MAKWVIEPLASRHRRQAFDCGSPPLDAFIRQHAGQLLRRGQSSIYVATENGSDEAGYHLPVANRIEYAHVPAGHARNWPRQGVASVLLARMAVQTAFQGQGPGRLRTIDFLRRAASAADSVSVLAVQVDAKDQRAADFDAKFGFCLLLDNPFHLFMPMGTVRALLASALP